MNPFDQADLGRRLDQIISLGRIVQVYPETRQIQVAMGDITTGKLPWPAEVGQHYLRWRPLRAGTQVVLACPSGDLQQAQVVGMLYTDALTPDACDAHLDSITFNDGTQITYDSKQHALSVLCQKALHLQADTLHLQAKAITIDGPITHRGGDINSEGISVQTHTHQDALGGQTGKPQ